jgi:uncharacterized protein (DUF885 family)
MAHDTEVDRLERAIVDHLFELQPSAAVGLGLHAYDGRLPDLATESTTRWAGAADELLARLAKLEAKGLDAERRIDLQLLRLLLEGPLFDLRELRELERNPMSYVGMFSLTSYMARDYAPAAERIAAMVRILGGAEKLLAVGRRRLAGPLPRPFVELAILVGEGLPTHFEEAETFAARHGDASPIRAVRPAAEAAVAGFVRWLKETELPRANDAFALGAASFQRLLWVREGLETPVEEIRRAGEADLERNVARLTVIAREMKSTPAELFRRLGDDHPAATDVLATARREVDWTRAFVQEHDLVSIPGTPVCRVEETPPYSRALTTASMSPPGPFETKAAEGIYFVTLVDPAWTERQQNEWLRSQNRAMLRNITVHEVYPGHYLQFLHFRQRNGSLARKVYLSPSFVEGWAHYTEQLAIESGLGRDGHAAELAQIHDALLRDCRLLASIGLHTQGWTVEQATRLFQEKAWFEEHPAQREAIRGTFNPEYFCYTLGKLAILKAREEWLGKRFGGNLRRFHDALLGSGCPPIGLLDSILERAAAA